MLTKLGSQGFHTKEQQISIRNATRHVRFKKSLTQKVNLFSAVSISTWLSERKKLTGDTKVLPTMSGMALDICDEDFSFNNKPMEMKSSSKEEYFFTKEIEKLLENGVIKESRREEGKLIYHPLFLS